MQISTLEDSVAQDAAESVLVADIAADQSTENWRVTQSMTPSLAIATNLPELKE